MVYSIAQHIITPIADTIEGNLQSLLNKRTVFAQHTSVRGMVLKKGVLASLFENIPVIEGYTVFESLCIQAIAQAVSEKNIDITSSRCVFILSSTKGDIWVSMAQTAKHIAGYFGNQTSPIVVSTACTSGVSAQLTAWRLLQAGMYDTAVVVGCDVQCEFIISGFQSFEALSTFPCKPFDKNRDGLNPGEAVAVMVMSTTKPENGRVWCMLGGSINNDANHISGPSRTGEGSLRCLEDMLHLLSLQSLACLSLHGTGTLYNDEMESIAVHRSGLQNVPVSALKGYYGHTMGAAGLLETILTMRAIECGMILPVNGYEQQGTTYAMNISTEVRHTDKTSFIKLLSGFGGVNAAVAWSLEENEVAVHTAKWNTIAELTLNAGENIDGLYRNKINDYPKYFKMDKLCRLGFVTTELLKQKLQSEMPDFSIDSEKCCVILASRMASVNNDTEYRQTIADKDNYYPSPSLFVYTLPNILAGEIAIRNHMYGETACYALAGEDEMEKIVNASLWSSQYTQALVGWVDYPEDENFVSHIKILTKE